IPQSVKACRQTHFGMPVPIVSAEYLVLQCETCLRVTSGECRRQGVQCPAGGRTTLAFCFDQATDRYPPAIWLVWIVVNADPHAMKINFGSARESSVVRIRI